MTPSQNSAAADDLMQTSDEINPAMKPEIDDLRDLASRHGFKIVPMTVAEYRAACDDVFERAHARLHGPRRAAKSGA